MAKKNVYAVRKGRQTGIFDSWDECRKQVEGFPGAEFKGFVARFEAEQYLSEAGIDAGTDKQAEPASHSEKAADAIAEGRTIAYVDGSYDKKTCRYSYGAVIIDGDGNEIKLSGAGDDPDAASMRNVAGEIMGSTEAIKYALAHGIESIEIYHDYMGIAAWPNGAWKANLDATKDYVQFVRTARQMMKIDFVKVKGHSGDRLNDMADSLAKAALGLA